MIRRVCRWGYGRVEGCCMDFDCLSISVVDFASRWEVTGRWVGVILRACDMVGRASQGMGMTLSHTQSSCL